jgi:subtilisin-like proprotein convertase family protein
MFAIAPTPLTVRRVIVTNMITHQLMGDLLGTLSHEHHSVVLNNHSPHSGVTNMEYVYDDSGENNVRDFYGNLARHTDGPGSLQNFAGQQGVGQWMFTMVDNAAQHVGTNLSFTVFLERQQDLTNGVSATVLPGGCHDEFIFVPAEATNLTVTVSIQSGGPGTGTVLMSVCPEGASGTDCRAIPILGTGTTVTINKSSLPPLNAGNYVIHVCNQGSGPITVNIKATLALDLNGIKSTRYTAPPVLIQDDAVTYSTQFVATAQKIVSVEVGLRVDHPRISDLAFTLISPTGKRIMLVEDRGADSPSGMGSGILVTNVFPTTRAGDANADTNVLNVGANQGTLIINYNFFTIPDQMQIFYDQKLLFDSGLIPGSGTFSVNFGPGTSTNVQIVMNKGNNSDPNTLWDYTATVVTSVGISYLVLTENTNLTTTPIKFAIPPFGGASGAAFTNFSSFEVPVGTYASNTTVDGWKVESNQVSVIQDPLLGPPAGSNVLALANGQISRTLNTTHGLQYSLSLFYRGPDIISWWRGGGDNGAPGNTSDYVGNANGTPFGNIGFPAGEVGGAFSFGPPDSSINVPDVPSLELTNSLSIEGWVFVKGPPAGVAGMVLFRGDNRGGLDPYYLDVEASGPGNSLVFKFVIEDQANNAAFIDAPATVGSWVHLAATLDDAAGLMSLYTNGALADKITTTLRPLGALDTNNFPGIGIGNHSSQPQSGFNYTFPGSIDELSVYGRALSASEVAAIYSAGNAGKFDPTAKIPDALSEAVVTIPGLLTNVITGNNNFWQSHPVSFTAPVDGTPLRIEGVEPGILLDNFSLSQIGQGAQYYLPEQSLDTLVGDSAFGEWWLEIRDSRAGPLTDTLPLLEGWQLNFVFATSVPELIKVVLGQPATNTIPPGQIGYFSVDVPPWANFATNILLADGLVNLWFNQLIPPNGNDPGDVPLARNVNSAIRVLSLGSTPPTPPLIPGSTYYLGVQNVGTSNVTASIQVDFDITPLFNGIPVSGVMSTNGQPRYFYFDVSTNANAATFQLYNLSGNLDLVARKGLPPPAPGDTDYASISPGTNDETIIVTTNSGRVPLSGGRWYLGVFNADKQADSFTILANEYTTGIPVIHRLVNDVPFPLTNAGPANAIDYFVYTVTTNAVAVRFEVNNPTADVTLLVHKGLPPLPTLNIFDFRSANPGTSNELVVVSPNTTPPLTNGDWYLGVVNVTGGTVSYSAKATEVLPGPTNIVITNMVVTSSNICLTWTSVPGLDYFVQGNTGLGSTNWVAVSPTITATSNLTTYCISLPSPFNFFRVKQGKATNIGTVTISSITSTTNGTLLRWSAAPTAQFIVQWTASLAPPNWLAFTNVVTSTTGNFSFLDDGSQTGGRAGPRFYRLLQTQ